MFDVLKMELEQEDFYFPKVPNHNPLDDVKDETPLIDFSDDVTELVSLNNEYTPNRVEYAPNRVECVPHRVEYAPPNSDCTEVEYKPEQFKYIPSKFEYVPPDPEQFEYLPSEYVPPKPEQFEYVPPKDEQFEYVPPKPEQFEYVPPEREQSEYVPPKYEQSEYTNSEQVAFPYNEKLENIMKTGCSLQILSTEELNSAYELAKKLNHRPYLAKIARCILKNINVNKVNLFNFYCEFEVNVKEYVKERFFKKKLPDDKLYELIYNADFSFASLNDAKQKFFPKVSDEEFYKNLNVFSNLPIKSDYKKSFLNNPNFPVNVSVSGGLACPCEIKDVYILKNERRWCCDMIHSRSYINPDGIFMSAKEKDYIFFSDGKIKYNHKPIGDDRFVDIFSTVKCICLLTRKNEIIIIRGDKVLIRKLFDIPIKWIEYATIIEIAGLIDSDDPFLTNATYIKNYLVYAKTEEGIKVYSFNDDKIKDVTHKYLPKDVKMVILPTKFILESGIEIKIIREKNKYLTKLIQENHFVQIEKNPKFICKPDPNSSLLKFYTKSGHLIKDNVIDFEYSSARYLKIIHK